MKPADGDALRDIYLEVVDAEDDAVLARHLGNTCITAEEGLQLLNELDSRRG